jgi:hypothetical protein
MKTSACILAVAAPALGFVPGMKTNVGSRVGVQANLQTPQAALQEAAIEKSMGLGAQQQPYEPDMQQFIPEAVEYVQQANPAFEAQAQPENVQGAASSESSSNGWQTAFWASLGSMGGAATALAAHYVYKNRAAAKADQGFQSLNGGYQPPMPVRSGFATRGNFALAAQQATGFEDALGAQPPLGFWDPLGLLQDADEERFDRLRTVEIKHGRIAMLATLGHIVTTAGSRVPLGPNEVKAGLAAFDTLPSAGLFVTLATIGLTELGFASIKDELEEYCEQNYPDLCIDRRKAVELNNGRAAQMGILALMVHEKLNNDPYIINSLLGSPVPFN